MSTTIGMLDLATGALGAGVVAALLNQGLVWLKEWLRDGKALKLRRQHAALALAVALERYALACAHGVGEIEQGVREAIEKNSFSRLQADVPDLVLPAPADWQCLPAALVARVLALPLEIRYAQQQADIQWDYDDPLSAAEGTVPRVGRLGWDAWNTAIALRRQQGLPEAAPNVDFSAWDFRTCLRDAANPTPTPMVTAAS
ncbi:hypothetical protein [Ralstonia thomasii]|jgi:hypothetical protein|uniref:Uncharacterized protein n=1 Tax=Ralstonia thomasii TaxID=3058596 RepID=A0ABN9JCV8_9RALS|nr:hypothetical protein [Ralstonia sp. LMG 18095]CAJ0807114.1 hypothetical protein LMG18095_04551 [Ralstonia sp. LMG 18095]